MSGVALVIISDGRGYLAESIPSLIENADPSWFSRCIVVDDSGDEENNHSGRACHLIEKWGVEAFRIKQGSREGGANSIRSAWGMLAPLGCDDGHVFHVEEDFTFNGPIPLPQMVSVLKSDPHLANIVLRRGPHGYEGPGGYVGDDPRGHILHIKSNGLEPELPPFTSYMVHDKGFWLNPCVYPTSIAARGWPPHGHEHDFSAKLRADGFRFAVYGTHDDAPRVTHIGDRRAAQWTW